MGSLSSPIVAKNNPSDILNPLDPEEFRRQGHMVVDFIADYYMKIERYSVLSQVKPGYLQKHLPKSAPYTPEPIETILQDVQRHIVPGITHWQSPNFFAYFPASHSIAGFVGEMLTSGFNVAGFNWLSSPAATELESIVTDWLGEMLKLPNDFLFSGNGGGVIQGTTCEAVLCTVIAARDKKLSQVGREKIGKMVVYCSDQTHSSFQKASRIAGIRPENFRAIETKRSAFFALSPDSLRSAICSDMEAGLIPLFLCATVGTTATSAVDPLRPLADIAKNYGLWLHVDAAYGGNACICPEFQHFLDGIENVDSFSLNMHKWLLTTLSCCCLWLKDPGALAKSLSTDPEYLRNKVSSSKQVVDYKDWQIPLTRRFQAMKLWLVLRSYGVANLQGFLRSHVEMAKHFERLVAADKRFEIVVPRNFSMVCFRLLPYEMNKMPSDGDIGNQETMEEHANELNRKLLESINESGQLFMTHAVVGGVYIIRFAVGATLTKDRHVLMAWKVVQENANGLLGSA